MPLAGNPLAVVVDAQQLDDQNWRPVSSLRHLASLVNSIGANRDWSGERFTRRRIAGPQ